VVCDEPRWKAAYDEHPTSIQLASACISTPEAKRLLADGAQFEALVLLNGAGEELVAELKARLGSEERDIEFPVERVRVNRRWPGSIEVLHDRLSERPGSEFFAGGG
jgi:hypothetical protein